MEFGFEGMCIMTSDVVRLARFYCELFETTSEGGDGHKTMNIGALGLAIWREGVTDSNDEKRMRELRKYCYAFMFTTQDVDAAYERAKRMGAAIQEPPEDKPWGGRAFVLNDPDGNRIHILTKLWMDSENFTNTPGDG